MAYERREYQGGAVVTSLSAGINAAATSFSVADATGWPDGTVGPFHVVIDQGLASEEKIRCLSRAGSTVTVDTGGRGADDTTASSHSAAAVVAHVFVAVDADEANAHYADDTLDHHSQYLDGTRHDARDHTTALGTANLADLADVAATSPDTGDGLVWDGSSWAPAAVFAPDAAELAYWRDQAALLDPMAYQQISGVGWSHPVPADETWYALNLWHVKVGSAYKFQRIADARTPLLLPGGTSLVADVAQTGYAYLCKPALVISDSRYDDPKALYYERLNRLRSLPLYDVTATIAAGSPVSTFATGNLPNDFDLGLATLFSVHDVAWITVHSSVSGLNFTALDETSDDHQIRTARATLVPFRRDHYDRIMVRSGSVSGNGVDTSIAGHGAMSYHKLPGDW